MQRRFPGVPKQALDDLPLQPTRSLPIGADPQRVKFVQRLGSLVQLLQPPPDRVDR